MALWSASCAFYALLCNTIPCAMEVFRTTFKIPESSFKLNYETPVMLIGSCFTENIGKRLSRYKFRTLSNPAGIVFNPVSMAITLRRIMTGQPFQEKDLLHYNNQWLSLEHHGSFSHADASVALKKMNQALTEARQFLKDSAVLMVTWGTAWVYSYKESGQVVANCHKLPQNAFDKRILSTQEIVGQYKELLQELRAYNPRVQVCFTLSPVRHWRDGAIENQRSKSSLHVAIQELVDAFGFCHYFPAYELQMDDLRDYRFYEADMIHPSEQAVDYIWDKFRQAWIDPQLFPLMEKIGKLAAAFQHRPHHAASEAYRRFAAQQIKNIEEVLVENPYLDFSDEIAFFQGKLR